MKSSLSVILLSLAFLATAKAQSIIEVHIDHGGLHCPILRPRFESSFTAMEEVDSVFVNRATSVGVLYLGLGKVLSDELIAEVVVNKVGYPKPEIKAIVREN
jgi:hypothetical protein